MMTKRITATEFEAAGKELQAATRKQHPMNIRWAGFKVDVAVVEGVYGERQPQIQVQAPRGSHYRELRAALHHLAAAVEEHTPEDRRWGVYIEVDHDDRGRVRLELVDDDSTDDGCQTLATAIFTTTVIE